MESNKNQLLEKKFIKNKKIKKKCYVKYVFLAFDIQKLLPNSFLHFWEIVACFLKKISIYMCCNYKENKSSVKIWIYM